MRKARSVAPLRGTTETLGLVTAASISVSAGCPEGNHGHDDHGWRATAAGGMKSNRVEQRHGCMRNPGQGDRGCGG